MIPEFCLGLAVSSAFIAATHFSGVTKTAEKWILAIAQFVYYSGHPLLDDDWSISAKKLLESLVV
ncbi:MAG: hypothetical protein AAFU85_04200, partial [Planctomycetota bacterium]